MERILSVSQLNEYVRRTLAADPMLRGVRLRGEISNFKRHSAGHLYFTLKDEESKISCVMFRSQAMGCALTPRDGMRVVLSGSAALYAASGQYQFYVDGMRSDGVGDLFIAFEKLKERLRDEGLFDAGRKKPLPLLPVGIGIVTSPTGAVLHDILRVAARRHPGVQLILRPSAVQGDGAAREIARAIAELDRREDVGVIIVGRGGGSLEELWAFNEEVVARAIYACKTPVVSAVGHDTDFTIADFVADVRAATPSQAAELTVPELQELVLMLETLRWRLDGAQRKRVQLFEHRLQTLSARLSAQRPIRRLAQQRARADALLAMCAARVEASLREKRLRADALRDRLTALSPKKVLERGYALVTVPGGKALLDARDAPPGTLLRVRLKKGALSASVMEEKSG